MATSDYDELTPEQVVQGLHSSRDRATISALLKHYVARRKEYSLTILIDLFQSVEANYHDGDQDLFGGVASDIRSVARPEPRSCVTRTQPGQTHYEPAPSYRS